MKYIYGFIIGILVGACQLQGRRIVRCVDGQVIAIERGEFKRI